MDYIKTKTTQYINELYYAIPSYDACYDVSRCSALRASRSLRATIKLCEHVRKPCHDIYDSTIQVCNELRYKPIDMYNEYKTPCYDMCCEVVAISTDAFYFLIKPY
jgi:hypothetical protein